MKIINNGESYTEKNFKGLSLYEKKLFINYFLLLATIIAGIILSVRWSSFLPIFLIIMIAGLMFPRLRKIYNKTKDKVKNFQDGIQGEDEVLKVLNESLSDDYYYIKNFLIPNTMIGDIDGLIVCPKGIILLEIKNYKGRFRFSGQDLFKKIKDNIYRLFGKSPVRQVHMQKDCLQKFLNDKNFSANIIPFVVMVDGKVENYSGTQGIFISTINNLVNNISNLNTNSGWTTDKISQAVTLLSPQHTKLGLDHR